MFEALIRQELPKTVRELYVLAKIQQPRDCQGLPCPHREKLRETDMEWMHQLRRELQVLAVCDGNRNSTWRLKSG